MKMFADLDNVKKEILDTKVDKPLSGTLSGHAAGEPFDKHVYKILKKQLPKTTYRQYEFLNALYSRNPEAQDHKSRNELIKSEAAKYLLSRSKSATTSWNEANQFIEKQNDTADILITDNTHYEIIDIKTRNLGLSPQPPNIISSYKLAQLAALMISNNEYDNISIKYFGIDWSLEGNYLVCKDAYYVDLFKENPANLYINWAAAMQVQFHISSLKQDYEYKKEFWVKDYLDHFVQKAKKRANDMEKKFVSPFIKYI